MKYDTIDWSVKVQAAYSSRTETNEIDFKEDLSAENDRLKEHINAFGNSDHGGMFVFGVTRDFSVNAKNLDHESITRKISSLARDTQEPALRVEVVPIKLMNKPLLGLVVHPGQQKPVFIKDRAPLGGNACFKRSGTSTVLMPISEIRDRLAKEASTTFDETTVDGCKFQDLDLKLLAQSLPSFKANDASSASNLNLLLDNRILIGTIQSYAITLAGWMTFANNPQANRKLKNAAIEFQQFRGKTRDTSVKKMEIVGTLPQQINLAIDTLMQHVWSVPKIQGSKRQDIPAYDGETLREVITNSVVHRDYSKMHQPVKIALFQDRLEIENPGGLMPGITPLNMIHKRDWRNPILARLMEKFGLGEMDGQGIDRIFAATRKIKVPAPIFIDNGTSFKVILSGPKNFEDFSSDEKRLTVIVLLVLENEVDNEGIRNAFNIDLTKASTLLKILVKDRVIETVGRSKKFAKYKLTSAYRQRIFGEQG